MEQSHVPADALKVGELGEKVMESVGDKAEKWSNRWWWVFVRWFVLIAPFIAIAIYYWVL